MDIIPYPGRQQVIITNGRTYTWSLDSRGPFKTSLSIMENPLDDGHTAQVNVQGHSPDTVHKVDHFEHQIV